MSAGGTKDKVGRLQELLERVQMRAAAARAHGASDAGHAAAAPPAAAAAAYEAPAAQTSPPPAAYVERDEEMSAAPAEPAHQTMPPTAEEDYDVNTDSDVEVSSEVVEVDIDIDEPMPLESGAQPVAQQTMPPEDLEEEVDEQPMATQPSVRPSLDEPREEEVAHAAPANEIEEPTPSSSRRPIAAEEASAEAYEPESAPRHTPPPESGKQVAAAPSAHPPSRKPSAHPSAPPPSLEGHTLIGGWREPGLGTPQISPSAGMSTGVRVPAAGSAGPGGTEPPATVVQGAGAMQAQASGTRLTADVTRAELASGVSVASFTGAPAIAKPKTLGELLDLTLGL